MPGKSGKKPPPLHSSRISCCVQTTVIYQAQHLETDHEPDLLSDNSYQAQRSQTDTLPLFL